MKWEKIRYPYTLKVNPGTPPSEYRLKIFYDFVQYFGFDAMTHGAWVVNHEKYFACDRSYNTGKGVCQGVPFDFGDHGYTFWKKGTKLRIFVSHPYQFSIERLELWCNQRELHYIVCPKARSFYFPTVTDMILIMHGDLYLDCLERMQGFPLRLKYPAFKLCQDDEDRRFLKGKPRVIRLSDVKEPNYPEYPMLGFGGCMPEEGCDKAEQLNS